MPEPSELEKRVRKAIIRARLDWEIVVEKLKLGELQWHQWKNSGAITSISVSGPYRTLYVIAVAGDIADIPELGLVLELFGEAMDCQVLETDGRLGFRALFEHEGVDRGYRQVSVKYRKDLRNGQSKHANDDNPNPEN